MTESDVGSAVNLAQKDAMLALHVFVGLKATQFVRHAPFSPHNAYTVKFNAVHP